MGRRYGDVTCLGWYMYGLARCTNFKGRASRKQFLCFITWNFIAFILVEVLWVIHALPRTHGIVDFTVAGVRLFSTNNKSTAIFTLIALLLFGIISVSICIRRLHDLGKSGKAFIISGNTWWLDILYITEGDVGDNAYGPDPKALSY